MTEYVVPPSPSCVVRTHTDILNKNRKEMSQNDTALATPTLFHNQLLITYSQPKQKNPLNTFGRKLN